MTMNYYIKKLATGFRMKGGKKVYEPTERVIPADPKPEEVTDTPRKNFLETRTEEELKTLKGAMITAREKYRTAVEIIAKNQHANPEYMQRQQGELEEVLIGFVKGDGLGGIADGLQLTPDKLKESLKPLCFTEEEFPLHGVFD